VSNSSSQTVDPTVWKRGLTPRVALIGPKSSGKTIYRAFLRMGQARLPEYVGSALRVRHSGVLQRTGVVLAYDDAQSQWSTRDEQILEPAEVELGVAYLPQVEGTTFLTCHELPLPDDEDTDPFRAGHLLDFPGEYFTNDPQHLYARYRAGQDEVDEWLLRSCQTVIMTLPFWAVLPRSLRQIPPHHEVEMGRHLGRSAEEVKRSREVREDALYRSAMDWFERLRPVVDERGPGKAPNLLVVFTMLGMDWHRELADDVLGPPAKGGPPRMVRALGRARRRIEHPIAGSKRSSVRRGVLPRWLRGPGTYLRQLVDAARLRDLLDGLDQDLARFVGLCKGASGDQWVAIADELLELQDRMPGRIRYTAMNIVNERELLRRHDRNRDYLKLEPAGAYFPTVFLCGGLDRTS